MIPMLEGISNRGMKGKSAVAEGRRGRGTQAHAGGDSGGLAATPG